MVYIGKDDNKCIDLDRECEGLEVANRWITMEKNMKILFRPLLTYNLKFEITTQNQKRVYSG